MTDSPDTPPRATPPTHRTPPAHPTGIPGTPGTPDAPGTPSVSTALADAPTPPSDGPPPADGRPGTPSTSTAPTPRQLWTRTRGIVLAAVILLATAVAIAAVRSGTEHGSLDPRSADPYGSRAVAELLADRGVSTRVVTTTAEARAAAGPDTTLLVANPDLLTDRQQSRLHDATEGSGGRTVLVAPGSPSVSKLAPGVTADAAPSDDSTLSPDCDLPTARRAGPADVGGIRYDSLAPGAEACYVSDGLPSLLVLPATSAKDGSPETANAPEDTPKQAEGAQEAQDAPEAPEGAARNTPEKSPARGDTVVLGAPDILHNDRLDKHGNASLALQLLGSRPHLVWYLPSLSDDAVDETADDSFFDLIPSGWFWGTLQLTLAAALAALWRGRRLGPLVPEKLPVAIRASETAEGRARLYRKADARDRAAAALRSATRTRLAPLVGVPTARAHTPEALLPALTSRLRTPGRDLLPLLFGSPPGDDAGLIALADQLDALESEVRTS
ncbi:DUF4350 domain-containing protein [Streptomyces flavofungini]|uniref:DUF4350 domain-containing protein n=1 Tax=Streptomyces flavofungini TaxID=68200 RepID=UPI0025B16B82|nr:DUF4350 domain-containing protein [Streptomyces flavofungini]WJV48336.1 DUF4350 domain-containing protein [Streptomyces flavofungini]